MALADSFGGVLVNRKRQVLLVRPSDPHSPYAWTFPKGAKLKKEGSRAAALRQVRLRTGYKAEVLATINSWFEGTLSTTGYFIMGPTGRQNGWGPKTAKTCWAELSEAERLIGGTTVEVGRDRDLAVLDEVRGFIERPDWSLRTATCREDWEVHPLPERRATLALDLRFDAAAALRIRKGWFPMAMEEKWFTWWEEPVLHLHRSWTGFCTYEVIFEADAEGLRAVSCQVSRDQEQYGSTDDEADRELLGFVLNDLFVEAEDGPTVDPFAAALAAAAQPNYLGSPAVVAALLGQIIDAALGYTKGEQNFNGCWDLIWFLSGDVAEGETYTRMPSWHSADALGAHLVTAFAVRHEPTLAGDLQYFVSEAFTSLFLKVRDMIRDFAADPHAEWERDALPQLNALHSWATAVFLGTDVVTHPGRTIADFNWTPAEPPA